MERATKLGRWTALKRDRNDAPKGGLLRHFSLALRSRWTWLVIVAVVIGLAIPIIASAYMSTGTTGDRNWYWQQQLPQGNDLRSTAWVNSSVGWAVGVSGTALKTTDGGATWVALDPGTNRDLTGMASVSATECWAVGVSGVVQHTTDGGTTWTAQNAPTIPAARNFRGVSFFNANIGVAVGDQGTTTSTIVYTSNGGATWRAASTTSTVGLSAVQMTSVTDGWAVGGNGTLLKTVDGGATWTDQPSPTVAGLSAVSFAPGGVVGYIVGNTVLPNWTIYKTTNGGATWTAVNGLGATGAINLTGVSCLDANNAVAVGTNGQIRHTKDGGATWLNQSWNNVGANSMRAVYMIDANNIKIVGDVGMIFYTSDSGNFWTTPMVGVTATYQNCYFADANHGWAVGNNGTIMRTVDAGQNWIPMASGIGVWRGVGFADLNNGWVVGDGGAIQHTTNGGASWVPQTSGSTQQLNCVWAIDANTAVAAGNGGVLLKTINGGTTWTAKTSGVTTQLNAVWFAADGTTGYLVGNGGVTRKTTNVGETWNGTASSGTTQNLLSVRGVSTTMVWAAGNQGVLLRTTDGGVTAWTNQSAAAGAGTNPIRTVFPVNASTCWFASNYGIVKKTTNGNAAAASVTWTQQNAGVPTNTLDPAVGFYGAWFADANTGYLVGDSAVIRRTGDGGANWHSQQYGSQSTLNAIVFTDSLNGWIPGNGGLVQHTDDGGQTWHVQKTGTGNALNDQSMVSSSTGWAVGDNGAIRRTTDGGLTWTGQVATTSTINLKCVSAVNATTAVAGGPGGTVMYTTDAGSTWNPGTIETTQQVNTISMVSTSTGFAVATRAAGNNVIWRTTDGGRTWPLSAAATTTANSQLWDIYFRPDGVRGFATGDSGVILRTIDSGAHWQRMSTPTTTQLLGISFFDDNNGIAVGGAGIVLVTSDGGTTWTIHSSGTTSRSLTDVGYARSDLAFIVGTIGTILRGENPLPPITALLAIPSAPDGTPPWYRSDPLIQLIADRPGTTTFYNWTSPAGPWIPYSSALLAPEGVHNFYYYSSDTLGTSESVNTTSFSVDFTPPTAPATVAASSVTTSTAQINWAAGTDAVSGVNHYIVYLNGSFWTTTSATSTALASLSPNTPYSITVATVDTAGNTSSPSSPISFVTEALVTTPLTTVLGVTPISPNGAGNWYVTTPTVTMAALPMSVPASITYSWTSSSGPYHDYTTTITPPAGTSTLYYSAHDPAHIRADEPTQQTVFSLDTLTPVAPSVVASATSYSSIRLTWPAVPETPSGITRYDVYQGVKFYSSTASLTMDVVGLSQNTEYSFIVYAINNAGTASPASAAATTSTPLAPLPAAPNPVFAKSPTGSTVYLNWTPSADTIGTANYRIYRRSSSEAEYSAIATTTGGVYDCAYIDSGLSSSTRYWYAVSTVDSRGESSLSDTTTATWNYTAPTTTLPDRIIGVNVVNLDSQVYLSWQAPADPAVYGYVVLRGSASMSTMTTISPLPPAPILGTGYFDSTVANGETYYYQVAAINTSQVVGIPSVEAEAKPLAPIPANQPQPHSFGNDSACICHATHSSTTLEPLVRFPGATRNTICKTCHAPVTSANNFTDPLLQSKHPMGADVTSSDPYTCTTCHVPLARNGTPLNNLMKTNSSSPCVVVTDTPAGNGFCYSCHGPGSTLVMGDLSVFQSSGHNTVPAPTNANIVCDTCHESHSSRNPQLLKYSGFMVCMQCHTASASNPAQVDILSRLMLNNGANSKHPLLPQDQTTGARMTCENCHNTHTTTTAFPLVDPHNPGPTGTWPKPRSDEKAFCFRCHDGSTLPTSAETTPWASAVFARGRVTTTAPSNVTTTSDIQTAYQVNQHGFGSRNPATTTANLRPDMGYGYGDVLECRSCHDPHGTANDNAILDTVKSANGSKSISGVLTYRISGGGKDFRFFCTACHVWDSASHDARASSITGVPTDTGTFPANCKKCHGHTVVATGTPEPAGWYF